MSTSTAKLQLLKPAGTDFVNVLTQLDGNLDKIDSDAGATVCTSSTRPASPYSGQVIYETDIDAICMWTGTLWKEISQRSVYALISDPESTSSATFTDLITVGPSVTFYMHESQKVKVTVEAIVRMDVGGTGHTGIISFEVSGGETIAVIDNNGIQSSSDQPVQQSSSIVITGSSSEGNRVFAAKYRAAGSDTAHFDERKIIVETA